MADFNSWVAAFGKEIPVIFWHWLAGWAWSYVLLVVTISLFRKPLSHFIGRFDGRVRRLAHRWRYKGPHTATEELIERVMLSWFFRFWTNFASAPSLIFLSFAVPIVIYMNAPESPLLFRGTGIWLMPGLCYAGSMLLSFWLKRVFKRVRPERKEGAFGHKLRDHSFPSGHSLTAFCFWTMCVASLAAQTHGVGLWLFGIAAAMVVLLTGISRIYLAVHWPSDVAGGYCIGTLWAFVCYVVLFRQLVGI